MKSDQTINMIQILGILRKHLRVVLGTTIAVTLVAIFMTWFVMVPQYSSTTEILVNRKLASNMQSSQFQQVQADVQMISTYKDIITSPTVLKDVDMQIKGYPGYPGSMNNLKKSLSISNSQNSQVFSVSAKSPDANTAAAIANSTAQVFKKKIGKIMNIDNVSIVSKAEISAKPVSPKKALNVLAGIIVGLFLGIAAAFIRELTDRTVSSESFLTDELGLISLGVVNEIDQKDIERTVEHKDLQAEIKNGGVVSRNHRRV